MFCKHKSLSKNKDRRSTSSYLTGMGIAPDLSRSQFTWVSLRQTSHLIAPQMLITKTSHLPWKSLLPWLPTRILFSAPKCMEIPFCKFHGNLSVLKQNPVFFSESNPPLNDLILQKNNARHFHAKPSIFLPFHSWRAKFCDDGTNLKYNSLHASPPTFVPQMHHTILFDDLNAHLWNLAAIWIHLNAQQREVGFYHKPHI